MRHGYFYSGMFGGNGSFLPIAVIIIILIFIGLAIYRYFQNRNNEKTSTFTDDQKQTLENFEALVCSMLAQNGAGLKQTEIMANVRLPLELVSEKLLEMEKEGTLTRVWHNEEFTYVVKKT